jgi:hypothetical protein
MDPWHRRARIRAGGREAKVEQHSADYRTVAVFGSMPDAEVARGLLESDGIVAAVHDAAGAAPQAGPPAVVRLLVPARDLDRARRLLAPAPDDGEHDLEAVTPPPELDHTWTVAWLALLVAAAVALVAAFAL